MGRESRHEIDSRKRKPSGLGFKSLTQLHEFAANSNVIHRPASGVVLGIRGRRARQHGSAGCDSRPLDPIVAFWEDEVCPTLLRHGRCAYAEVPWARKAAYRAVLSNG